VPAADAPSFEEINTRWRDLLKATRKLDLTADALLNSAKPYGIDGFTVILQMPSELLRDKIEADHNRQIVEKALKQVFGKPLKFRCKVGGGTSAAGSQSREVDDLLAHDSLAAFAVNDLGGTVKRVKKSKDEEKPS
jgi:hypothetical protein